MILLLACAVVVLAGWAFVLQREHDETDAALQAERRDSAALQQHAAALQRHRALDVAIFNGLSEAVLAIDRQRRIVFANDRFAELFEVERPAGRLVHDVVRVAAVFEALDDALAGRQSVERFTSRSGIAERTIEMRLLPQDDLEIAAVAIFIDVTQLQRLETIRRNFISDFSHEVRTPLTGLRTAVETHEDVDQLTEEEARQLRRIMSRQLRRLGRLVDDLSELSRIESGDLLFSRVPVDLRALADDLCEDFSDRAAQLRIRMRVSGPSVTVAADPLRIQQAVSNLIDNAMKYAGEDKPIEVTVADLGTRGEIRVTDHGEGIAESERENIFRRFYRIDKSRSQQTGGSGLGLAITKHIVLQHHGSIDVESEPGEGATFIVRLPKGESAA